MDLGCPWIQMVILAVFLTFKSELEYLSGPVCISELCTLAGQKNSHHLDLTKQLDLRNEIRAFHCNGTTVFNILKLSISYS